MSGERWTEEHDPSIDPTRFLTALTRSSEAFRAMHVEIALTQEQLARKQRGTAWIFFTAGACFVVAAILSFIAALPSLAAWWKS